jgi:hypothetical protein
MQSLPFGCKKLNWFDYYSRHIRTYVNPVYHFTSCSESMSKLVFSYIFSFCSLSDFVNQIDWSNFSMVKSAFFWIGLDRICANTSINYVS